MISVTRKKQVLNYHITYGYGAKKIRSVMIKEGKQPMSRNTIRKLINQYEEIKASKGLAAALDYTSQKDEFHTPERQRTKLDAEACKFIEGWLETNKRRKILGEGKQCIDMQEVWRLLTQEKGYDICYSTVTAYAREYVAREEAKKLPKSKECFIRQFHPAGEECQFDWGDVKLKIGGKKLTVRMAAFVLPHSNHRRGFLFIREHTLAFMESHRNYFRSIGHIPQCMVYDNMKVAVKSFVGEKEPTDALLDMSNFYGFHFRFCNARRGNEKGNVEETVKVLRKAAFAVRMEFDTLEEAQEYLDMVCDRLNHTEQSDATENIVRLAEEDFAAMMPWKDDFACFQLVERQVGNYGTIDMENAHYSVPDTYTLCKVKVRNYTNKIEVLDEKGNVVAAHEKVPEKQWKICLEHYLHTLSYKPGALKNSEALRQAPEGLRRLFNDCFKHAPKEFVELLEYAKLENKTFDDVIDAYEEMKKAKVRNMSLDVLKSTLSAEKASVNITYIINVQQSEEIERNAVCGLEAAAQLMESNIKHQQGYAGIR